MRPSYSSDANRNIHINRFKVALLDKDGNVTYEARGVQPKPKTCMTMLFPAGRHIRVPFNDPEGNTIFSYDMPKKPCCGKRKGAKVVSGAVVGPWSNENEIIIHKS